MEFGIKLSRVSGLPRVPIPRFWLARALRPDIVWPRLTI